MVANSLAMRTGLRPVTVIVVPLYATLFQGALVVARQLLDLFVPTETIGRWNIATGDDAGVAAGAILRTKSPTEQRRWMRKRFTRLQEQLPYRVLS